MNRKFNNIGDVRQWIEDNGNLRENEDPQQAALWWHANSVAALVYDLSTKELASELLSGGIPEVTPVAIQEYLDAVYEDMNVEEANETIEEDLRAFFMPGRSEG